MKLLKNNIWTLIALLFLFCVAVIDPALATDSNYNDSGSVFGTARTKLGDLFKNAKTVLFVIGGFGLIALAFQAIFGKVKWPWFAALAFGLAIVAAAGAIVDYAIGGDSTNNSQYKTKSGYFDDSLIGTK